MTFAIDKVDGSGLSSTAHHCLHDFFVTSLHNYSNIYIYSGLTYERFSLLAIIKPYSTFQLPQRNEATGNKQNTMLYNTHTTHKEQMHLKICIYIHTHLHIYVCIYTHVYNIYIGIYMHTYVHVYVVPCD